MIHVIQAKSFRDGTLAEMDGLDAVARLVKAGGYHRVAEVDTEDMEKAFELTNSIDKPWTENEGVKVIGGPRKRSTSVGDIMLKGHSLYMVADVGFEWLPMQAPFLSITDAGEES